MVSFHRKNNDFQSFVQCRRRWLLSFGFILTKFDISHGAFYIHPVEKNSFGTLNEFRNSKDLFGKRNKQAKRGGRRKRHEAIQSFDEKEQQLSNNKTIASPSSSQSFSETTLRKPSQTKQCWVRLERSSSSSPLDVCLIEIDDTSWWEQANNSNPYGARLWPPSLAISKFLAKYLDHVRASDYYVTEVGCGTGLISIVAAACGAKALATDVSATALSLVQEGWSQTSNRLSSEKSKGNLEVTSFDLFSNEMLPMQDTNKSCILVASAVLYDKDLAKAMAGRVMEACEKGVWVILADDDTGLREGGREVFEEEWEKLVTKKGLDTSGRISSQWSHSTIQQKDVFGWSNKPVQLLHFNRPDLQITD